MRRPELRIARGRIRLPAGVATACILLLTSSGAAQMSRLSIAPPISEVREGDALLGVGVSYGLEQEFPLSGLRGDLISIGRLAAAYAIADRAVLEVRWDALRVLRIDEVGPSAVPLADGVTDGQTSDAGDVRMALTWAPGTLWGVLSAGGWVAVELPNSEERRGIGTNTTNALMGAVFSMPLDRVTLTTRFGLGVLESPPRLFSQDDVLVYSLDAIIEAAESVRLLLSIDGRTNPRRRVSLGAEDVGVVRVGAEFGIGRWRLDAELGRGFAHRSPDWQIGVGVSWVGRRD
ncbi:MAG: hypothetical protein ACE5FP_09585 [Gemmatimonadota bacterium]